MSEKDDILFDPENLLGKYILIDKRAVPCGSLMEWSRWMALAMVNNWRRVAFDIAGSFRVSTVFLGLDHNFNRFGTREKHRPILFETLVFGPDSWADTMGARYSTWEEAEAGHADFVKQVQQINAQISGLTTNTVPLEDVEEPVSPPVATPKPQS